MYLLRCPSCGRIFKIIKEENNNLITDMNGVINNSICLNCKDKINISENLIKTDDWIADLIFKIKGK